MTIGLLASPARSHVIRREIRCVGEENLTGGDATRKPHGSTPRGVESDVLAQWATRRLHPDYRPLRGGMTQWHRRTYRVRDDADD